MRRVDGGIGDGAGGADSWPSQAHTNKDNAAGTTHAAGPADAADIEALLLALSELRLTVSADLSAAAGALDADRPDIAADVVAGARRDISRFRSLTRRRAHTRVNSGQLVTAGVGGGALPAESAEGSGGIALLAPPSRRVHRGRRTTRALIGALALAATAFVVPNLAQSNHPAATGAAPAVQQQFDAKLVSAEFAAVRTALSAKHPSSQQVLLASDKWHSVLTRGLPVIAAQPALATQVVQLLRQERTLMAKAPSLTVPQGRAVAAALINRINSLFAQLRALANGSVLALLPANITPLPTKPTKPAGRGKPHGSTRKPLPQPTTTVPGQTGTTPVPAPTPPQLPTTTPGVPSGPSVPPSAPGQPGQLPLPLPLPLPLSGTQQQPTSTDTSVPSVLDHLGTTLGDALTGGLGGH